MVRFLHGGGVLSKIWFWRIDSNESTPTAVSTFNYCWDTLLHADLIETSPSIFPTDSVYSLAPLCLPAACLENVTISNFTITNDAISGGNEIVDTTATLRADAYQNNSGTLGMFIAPVAGAGSVDITFFGKDTYSQLGTFNDQITTLDFTGMLPGHEFELMLNPGMSSTGQASVSLLSQHPPAYRIESFFDVFTELSIDGGPPVPGPEHEASLAPEPTYYSAIAGIAAIAIMARIRFGRRGRA